MTESREDTAPAFLKATQLELAWEVGLLGRRSLSLPPCSWEVNSNKKGIFSTELGLCSPREFTSDKIGRLFLQSWGWAGELELQLQQKRYISTELGLYSPNSTSSDKSGRHFLQTWD